MNFLRSIAILFLALITVSFATGNSATLTWTAPTAYTSGEALPAIDIAFYTISWGNGASSVKVLAPALTTVVTVPCGSTNFVATVTTSATALYPNSTSASTNQIPYVTGIGCVPNPPAALAVH
ncbi:MAG: hypothetical protein ACREDR_01225 [Blastocatellia bacterium]